MSLINTTDLKRLPLKYIRDRAKSKYKKDKECYICGEFEILDFHHFYTLDILFEKWLKKTGYTINTVEDILFVRDLFIEDHPSELYVYACTLCRKHHKLLHELYGKRPLLATASKQERWVEKQRLKFRGNNETIE